MLSKLQLQEPQATAAPSDRLRMQPAQDRNSTETLPEATLQLTGLHNTAQAGADYLTPAGVRWTQSKVYCSTHTCEVTQHKQGLTLFDAS